MSNRLKNIVVTNHEYILVRMNSIVLTFSDCESDQETWPLVCSFRMIHTYPLFCIRVSNQEVLNVHNEDLRFVINLTIMEAMMMPVEKL